MSDKKCECGCGNIITPKYKLSSKKLASLRFASKSCARKWNGSLPHRRAISSNVMNRLNQQWNDSGEIVSIYRKLKTLKGMPDHCLAKQWVLKSPSGVIFRFQNLEEWARANAWLFFDKNPKSKRSHALRIAGGINTLNNEHTTAKAYQGWTIIECLDAPTTRRG